MSTYTINGKAHRWLRHNCIQLKEQWKNSCSFVQHQRTRIWTKGWFTPWCKTLHDVMELSSATQWEALPCISLITLHVHPCRECTTTNACVHLALSILVPFLEVMARSSRNRINRHGTLVSGSQSHSICEEEGKETQTEKESCLGLWHI